MPIKLPYTMEKENVKKKCREQISKWGLMRRTQKLREERGIMVGTGTTASSALSQLMRKAEAQLKARKQQARYGASSGDSGGSESLPMNS